MPISTCPILFVLLFFLTFRFYNLAIRLLLFSRTFLVGQEEEEEEQSHGGYLFAIYFMLSLFQGNIRLMRINGVKRDKRLHLTVSQRE